MASAKGARTGAIWGTNLLMQNQGNVLSELDQGYNASKGLLGQQQGVYQGLADQGQGGLSRYQSLTTGSPQDIQTSLEGTPGYQFNLGQGLQALQRTRAAQGMLNSGNTDTDTMQFASGLASNTLNQERAAQMPLMDLYKSGTMGVGGSLGTQAGLATDYYGNRGSVLDNTTKSVVGLGTEALKAGDAAKAANQQMALGAASSIAGLAGKAFGGGFTSLLSGFGK